MGWLFYFPSADLEISLRVMHRKAILDTGFYGYPLLPPRGSGCRIEDLRASQTKTGLTAAARPPALAPYPAWRRD